MKIRNYWLLIAIIITPFIFYPSSVSATETIYFIHQDHLGSTSIITDSTGGVVEKQVYYPFGNTRQAFTTLLIDNEKKVTERQYTSQVSDQNINSLYYYNARYYNPLIAKFTQADKSNNTPNRYAYVNNNPLRYTDPTGNIDWDTLGEDSSGTFYDWGYIYEEMYYLNHRLLSYYPSTYVTADDGLNALKLASEEPETLSTENNSNLSTSTSETTNGGQGTDPYFISPQSSVFVNLDRKGGKGNRTITVQITVTPNPKVKVAIDPFLKIIIPKGAKVISNLSSNQSGWGQNYYADTNSYLVDNYNISYGNKFTLTFTLNANNLEGVIKVETWSDLYYNDQSHEHILQTVDNIPLAKGK